MADRVTTSITVTEPVWLRLRRLAEERADRLGERKASASALISDLVDAEADRRGIPADGGSR